MKSIVSLTLLCLFSVQSFAQVGIGTNTPHASAKLEISSTTQGFLPPRVSLTATNAASPVTSPETGLLVYNIAPNGSGVTAVTPGFYYWGGSAWVRLIVPTDNAANVTGTVAVANGGTGATTLTGILKGNGTSAFTTATAGTDYLAPNGSAANLTNFPTLNQNTTGTAANVSGTVAVANGGTGATTLTGILKGNGTSAFTAAVAGTDYQAPISGTTNYLPKVTGAGNVGNSQIFDDATSVGIGSNNPNASAKLDVSSTTQGFLPPRMTSTQRNAISSPAQGLVVYCTNCGSNGELQVYNGQAWTNMLGGVRTLVIGESYGGGIVFYILQPEDPGYNANVQKGLIAATTDQNSTGIFWNNGSYSTTNASGTSIGTGFSNTNTIITAQGATSTNYAAGIARAHTGGGFNDWYLPSKDELNKLYLNKSAIGNLGSYYYWSSSESSSNGAWVQRFADGLQQTAWKNDPAPTTPRVRAIRSF